MTPHHTTDVQLRQGIAFRDLHHGPRPFVVPNPWDAGSARILAAFGFAALATTGAGLATASAAPTAPTGSAAPKSSTTPA